MKPRALLDVDGVLGDFVQAALDVLRDVSGAVVDPSTITTWELFDSIPEPHKRWRDTVYGVLSSRGGCARIPVYSGAQEGVARLREVCDVTIVTSPFPGSPTWMHERERWLGEHFGFDRKHVVHAIEKHHIHGHVFIDDKLSHLREWSTYWEKRDPCAKAVLWETPRTRGEVTGDKIRRVASWDELITFLKREFAT